VYRCKSGDHQLAIALLKHLPAEVNTLLGSWRAYMDEWVAAVFHADEVMQQMQFYAGDVPVKTWLALVGAHGPASSSCSRPANNI
jgi:hypothetical protein